MSKLAIVKAPESFGERRLESLCDILGDAAPDDMRIVAVNADIEQMERTELVEYLGHIVSILGWELDNE